MQYHRSPSVHDGWGYSIDIDDFYISNRSRPRCRYEREWSVYVGFLSSGLCSVFWSQHFAWLWKLTSTRLARFRFAPHAILESLVLGCLRARSASGATFNHTVIPLLINIQLLVTSYESLKSSNSLSQDVYSAKSCITIDRRFQPLHTVRPSNSAEEFIACSKYELNDIDEDDYVFETVDNESRYP